MTKPDPVLNYATPQRGANPRWGLRIAAGFAGCFLLLPAIVFFLFAIGCMISTWVELVAVDRSFASVTGYMLGFVFFAFLGVLFGGTAAWLIGFAERNSFRTRNRRRD